MPIASNHIGKGHDGSIVHNSRENYSHSVVFPDEQNELSTTAKQAFKIYREELAKRAKAYTERTGQKLNAKTITHFTSLVNLESHHTLKDLEPLVEYLEKELDTKVFQVAIHRDEGKLISKEDGTELYSGQDFFRNPDDGKLYYDKNYTKKIDLSEYEIVKNYHAHIEFVGLDSKGNSIKRNYLNEWWLSNLQDVTADILKMKRREKVKREKYTKEEMQLIKSKLKPKSEYESDKEYAKAFNRVAKELGIYKQRKKVNKKKRKDVNDFKEEGSKREQAKRAERAKLKDLKKEIADLRAELKELHALRPQYAKLEAENKRLREQIKAKELTEQQLKAEIEQLRQQLLAELEAERKKRQEAEAQNATLKQNINRERSRAKKLLETAKQLRAELNKLQNIANEKEIEYALKLEEYKNASEKEKEQLKAELEQLKDERDAEQKQNAERISELLNDLQYYKNKNDDLLALSRKKHIANRELEKENKRLQKELENAVKTEVVEKEKIVEKVVYKEDTTKIQQLEKRIKELEDENVTLKQNQPDERIETYKQFVYNYYKQQDYAISELFDAIRMSDSMEDFVVAFNRNIFRLKDEYLSDEFYAILCDFVRDNYDNYDNKRDQIEAFLTKKAEKFNADAKFDTQFEQMQKTDTSEKTLISNANTHTNTRKI